MTQSRVPLKQITIPLTMFYHQVSKTVTSPQLVYASRPEIILHRAETDLVINVVQISCNDYSPGAELTGDWMFADDTEDFTNATLIKAGDTTNGVSYASSSFDEADVPANKYIYFKPDASPHADIKDFHLQFSYYYLADADYVLAEM